MKDIIPGISTQQSSALLCFSLSPCMWNNQEQTARRPLFCSSTHASGHSHHLG